MEEYRFSQSSQGLKIHYRAKKVKHKWKFSDKRTKYFAICRFPKGEKPDTDKAENLLTIQAVIHKKKQKCTDKNTSPKPLYQYDISALDRLQNESLLNYKTISKVLPD